jgi:hypothetical protein
VAFFVLPPRPFFPPPKYVAAQPEDQSLSRNGDL